MSHLGDMVSFEALGKSNSAYAIWPKSIGPWQGVVVVQEWWGLDDHIKNIADRLAEADFAVIAPDLYDGEVATEPDQARKLRMALVWDDALAIIQGAINFLVAHPGVSPKKIGVTGFCMGGGLTWHAAAKLEHIGAVAPFYGGGPEMTNEEVARINVPVLAVFGELDKGVSREVANRRAAQMDKAGVQHETIIYPEAQHAFFNDTRAVVYNPAVAADAWQRLVTFFQETLVEE